MDRVDRRDLGGGGGEQTLRARDLIGKVQAPSGLLVVGRAERGGEVLRAPGQRDEPRMRGRIGAEARTSPSAVSVATTAILTEPSGIPAFVSSASR